MYCIYAAQNQQREKYIPENHIGNTVAPIQTHTMSHSELLVCLLDFCAVKIEFSEKSGFSSCHRNVKACREL